MRKLLIGFVVLGLAGCAMKNAKYDKAFVDIDSLVNQQVASLVAANASLEKKAALGKDESVASFTPDSTGWSHELELFRQLDAINKPSFREGYNVEVKRDTQSNLQVLALTSREPNRIPSINFYFFGARNNLKKVDARLEEVNPLFANSRLLQMTFDDEFGKPVITGYTIRGFQKMILGDTVRFSIESRVQRVH
ncbi:MAG: hypothetical protein ACOYW3_04065 [Bacteroidota bacterium]